MGVVVKMKIEKEVHRQKPNWYSVNKVEWLKCET